MAGSIGTVTFKQGYDVDVNAGYDFGMFRVEGELGYKHAKVNHFNTDIDFFQAVNSGAKTSFLTTDDLGFSKKVSVLSGMVNGMFEIGDDAGWSGFAGGGIGYAQFKELGDSEDKFAWQAFAGVRAAVTDTIDVGIKYRFFRSLGRLSFDEGVGFAGVGTGSSGTAFMNTASISARTACC